MSRYAVQYTTTASTIVYVEADSPEEAGDAADAIFEEPTLCAQCAGWGRDDSDANTGIELAEWEADTSPHGVWKANR